MHFHLQSRIALILVTIGLAGCGAGSGGRINGTPAPPAAPPPMQPPTLATPAFRTTDTYYSATAAAAEGPLSVTTDADGRFAVTGISSAGSNEPRIALHYVGPDRYELDWDWYGVHAFNPGDRIASDGPFEVYRQTRTAAGMQGTLAVAKPETLQLTYASLGNYAFAYDRPPASGAGSVEGAVGFFATGSMSGANQLPTTGRATYTGIADGLWIDGATVRRLFGSTAVLEADFATGNVTSTLNLVGRGDPFGNFTAAPATTLGQFVGTGRLSEAQNMSVRFFNNFSGTYAPAAGYTGSFTGHFFGPSVAEVGLSFRLTGAPGQQVFGAAVGRR